MNFSKLRGACSEFGPETRARKEMRKRTTADSVSPPPMETGRRHLLSPESLATNRRRPPHVGSHEALAGARTHRPAPARHGEPRHPPGTKSNASPGRSAYSADPHRHGPPPRVLRQRPSARSIPRCTSFRGSSKSSEVGLSNKFYKPFENRPFGKTPV